MPEETRKRDWGKTIALALAGVGDSINAYGGGKSSYGPDLFKALEARAEDELQKQQTLGATNLSLLKSGFVPASTDVSQFDPSQVSAPIAIPGIGELRKIAFGDDEMDKVITPERALELSKKFPGVQFKGTDAEGFDITAKIANMTEEIDKKIAEGTVAERFKIRAEDREPQQKAKIAAATAEVERTARLQQKFDDIQVDLLAKGTDLSVDEKARLISAKEGSEAINLARELVGDELTYTEIFSSGSGALATIASFDKPEARKLQTAVRSAITSYVFAKSGAQVSDKERINFENIYGPKIGDTIDSVQFKMDRLERFFQLADDILDPNNVAGMTTQERAEKIEIMKRDMLRTGASKEQVTNAVQAVQNISDRIINSSPEVGENLKGLFD